MAEEDPKKALPNVIEQILKNYQKSHSTCVD